MPVLHKHKDSNSYYVLTSIKGQVVAFQLTVEGYAHLQEAGIVLGKPFNRFLLLDLYRKGYAFTGHSGVKAVPRQGVIDFPDDPEPETMFPSCSGCSSLDDLHLVEIKADEPHASILCAACRKQKQDSIDTSVPLPLITRGILARFLEMKNIKEVDSAVRSYKDLLDAEFSQKWEVLARKKPLQETLLDKGSEPQGSLL